MLQKWGQAPECFALGIKRILILVPLTEFLLQRTQTIGSFHSKANNGVSTSHEKSLQIENLNWVSEN